MSRAQVDLAGGRELEECLGSEFPNGKDEISIYIYLSQLDG